jgi:hypothetical protein
MNAQQVSDSKICFEKEIAVPVIQPASYYVELSLATLDDQGALLDSLIQLTFDSLHIRHLNLRIIADAH